MDVDNTFIKPILLFYFGKGKSEVEAHEEITKQYGQYAVCLKTIIKWYKIFRKGNSNSTTENKELDIPKQRFTNETLINLVNENPNFKMEELAKVLDTSTSTICYRLKQINRDNERVNYLNKYSKKGNPKVTDEFLISLVNDNPGRNMTELGEISGINFKLISRRLKQINDNRDKDNKITIKRGTCKSTGESTEITDEFLIDLINNNPGFNMTQLARLADTSRGAISRKLNRINDTRDSDNKITLQNNTSQSVEKAKVLTDEFVIKLVNNNPSLCIRELAKLAGVSSNSLSNRIKKINRDGERANYVSKSAKKDHHESNEKPQPKPKPKPAPELTDEFLINLVNENPDLKLKQLAKLAGVSVAFLSKRIKQINWIDKSINYENHESISRNSETCD